jgi:hypothetical protein
MSRSIPKLYRLESRLAPSVAGGDYYWADGRQVALTERPHQVAVRFDEPQQIELLAKPGGLLAGYEVLRSLDPTAAFIAPAISPRPLASEAEPLDQRPGIDFAAPVFTNSETGGWVVATNEIIVRLQPGIAIEEFAGSDWRFAGYKRVVATPDTFVIELSTGSGRASLNLANELMTDPRLVWASPNLMIESHLWTNDPLYPNQWHLNNTGQTTNGLPDADVDAPEAWQITTGNPNIVIADIDDAIQRSHPDLAPNVWVNPGEIPGNSIDDDGNGWADDDRGWDFWNNDNDPSPSGSNSHGTATAGVAVAAGNNNLGVAGVAYGAKLMPIKSNIVPALAPADVATAVYYTAGRTANGTGTWRGADILTCSWGFDAPLQALSDAFAWASTNGRGGKGLPIFIASGNGGTGTVGYPANLAGSLSGVMAVGGSSHTDVRVGYSQYGPQLDFLAPTRASSGNGIYTTDRTGSAGYSSTDYTSNFSGTSSATPLAAGVGALALGLNPNLTAVQLRGLLHNTADMIGPQSYDPVTGKNLQYGFGRVNAAAAVRGVGVTEIQVLDGSSDVPNGSTESEFDVAIGANVTRTFRIRNQGTEDLILSSLAVPSGPFSISAGFTDSVLSVGEATTFTVRFAPTAGGTFDRNLTFSTNDSDEGSFVIQLSGTAPMPPQIGAIAVNNSAQQRSMVKTLTITFDRIVTLPAQMANAFSVIGPGGAAPFTAASSTTTGVTVVTLTFPTLLGGSLADGNYTLTVFGNQISAGGVPLDGDGDAVPGGNAAFQFFRYFGDTNGDRQVDGPDLSQFSSTFNLSSAQTGYLSYLDANADGQVDGFDFSQFSGRFATILSPP